MAGRGSDSKAETLFRVGHAGIRSLKLLQSTKKQRYPLKNGKGRPVKLVEFADPDTGRFWMAMDMLLSSTLPENEMADLEAFEVNDSHSRKLHMKRFEINEGGCKPWEWKS